MTIVNALMISQNIRFKAISRLPDAFIGTIMGSWSTQDF